MAQEKNYETIERPYDAYLQRSVDETSTAPNLDNTNEANATESQSSVPASIKSSGSSGDNGNVETQPAKSDGSSSDVWIKNFIRSDNWKPKKVGFYINGQTGYAEFSNVYVSGNIQAVTGNIGGFAIGATTISTSNITLDSYNQRITLGSGESVVVLDANDLTYRMWVGSATAALAPFSVTGAGAISATSGTIGGFTINSTSLYGGIIKTSLDAGAGDSGVIMDTDGLRGFDTLLGTTFNIPNDGSQPRFSSGVIISTTFEVDSASVIRTSETVGDGTANSAGILINSTGVYGCATNQLLQDANIKILTDGTATFNASVRGGQTDFMNGTGYFLGLSGDQYKFSIGSLTNYMTWDGSFLKLRGSFDVGENGVINNSVYTVATLPISPTVETSAPADAL